MKTKIFRLEIQRPTKKRCKNTKTKIFNMKNQLPIMKTTKYETASRF